MDNVYTITKPTGTPHPLVFDSPHSGRRYPEDFGYACDFDTLKAAEDSYVDDLFDCVPDYGGALLCAHFPRSYIDPNRTYDDIDPRLLDGPWDGPFPIAPTARSHAGIGLIRRELKPGIPVYDRALTCAEITGRIDNYYTPYHKALERLITGTHRNFGQIWHINCHSMPASTARPKRITSLSGNIPQASDFVLGNHDGTSCDPDFTRALRDRIKSLGYSVTINDPFKGAELITRYSNPAAGRHSLQIEINKALYMNEQTGEKNKNYNMLKNDINKIVYFCATFAKSRLTDSAAE